MVSKIISIVVICIPLMSCHKAGQENTRTTGRSSGQTASQSSFSNYGVDAANSSPIPVSSLSGAPNVVDHTTSTSIMSEFTLVGKLAQFDLNGPVHSFVTVNDGLVVGGDFTSKNRIFKILSTGLDDSTFALEIGNGPNGPIQSMIYDYNNQSLFVGGSFESWNSHPCTYIVKLDTNGKVDEHFCDNTKGLFNGPVQTLAMKNTSLAVGGSFTSNSLLPSSYLAVLDIHGNLQITNTSLTSPSPSTALIESDPGPIASSAHSPALTPTPSPITTSSTAISTTPSTNVATSPPLSTNSPLSNPSSVQTTSAMPTTASTSAPTSTPEPTSTIPAPTASVTSPTPSSPIPSVTALPKKSRQSPSPTPSKRRKNK